MLKSYRRSILWIVIGLVVGYLVISSNLKPAEQRTKTKKTSNLIFLSDALGLVAIILVVVGLGTSFAGWRANANAGRQAAQLVNSANASDKSASTKSKNSTANNVPGTTKPSATIYANYSVSPNLPRYIIIPKLDIAARVLTAGVNTSGAIQTPSNVYDTAWYNGSALPGQPGAMLIDGHVSSWTQHGVFYNLQDLRPGDIIKIQRGDGTNYTYSVSKIQLYDANNVDMTAAVSPINPGQPGLNLITCAGNVVRGSNGFSKRLIVFATQN